MTFITERLLSIMLAVTCSQNVYARPRIYLHVRLERDNNTNKAIYVMRRRWQFHSSSVFGVKKQKCLMAYTRHKMKHFNYPIQSKPLQNRLNHYRETTTTTIPPKIFTLKRFGDSGTVQTIKGYVQVKSDVTSSSSF